MEQHGYPSSRLSTCIRVTHITSDEISKFQPIRGRFGDTLPHYMLNFNFKIYFNRNSLPDTALCNLRRVGLVVDGTNLQLERQVTYASCLWKQGLFTCGAHGSAAEIK